MARCPAHGNRIQLNPSGAVNLFGATPQPDCRWIDACLRKEAGSGTELDYTEQTSWLLFLKYLDGLEDDRAAVAALESRSYTPILEEPYRWSRWAAPKNASGQLDHHAALTGDDLRDFVNAKLFPYLERFKQRASGPKTIEYKTGACALPSHCWSRLASATRWRSRRRPGFCPSGPLRRLGRCIGPSSRAHSRRTSTTPLLRFGLFRGRPGGPLRRVDRG